MVARTITIICLLIIGVALFFLRLAANPVAPVNNPAPATTTVPQSPLQVPQIATQTAPRKIETEEKSSPRSTPQNNVIPAKPARPVRPAIVPPIVKPDIIAPKTPTTPAPKPGVVFLEDFSTDYSVVEADNIADRTSPGWWLGSGGYFNSAGGVGETVMGPLTKDDPLRLAYAASNPTDTDNGYYPQNIFRLVLMRGKWQNFQQSLDFKIINNNLSQSSNRNESNGLFFFNRYQDANNLYYTGLRVDGAVVIKKKIKGTYYDLAYSRFFTGGVYSRANNPNLLPTQKWIGLRSEIITNSDNTVRIKLFVDTGRTGKWVLATEAIDDGKSYGGNAILNEGYTGIRTDFMDVQFDNYQVTQE